MPSLRMNGLSFFRRRFQASAELRQLTTGEAGSPTSVNPLAPQETRRPLDRVVRSTDAPVAALLCVMLLLGAALEGVAEVHAKRIKSFGFPEQAGASPAGNLILASDGALYGTTSSNSDGDGGAVYRVNPDGSNYHVLHSFGRTMSNSGFRHPGLIEGRDGALYGATSNGGSNNFGTVFRLNKDGSGYSVLHHFQGGSQDGSTPRGELLEATDGSLYGTTGYGGTNSSGTVFTLSKDGSNYTVLHWFHGFQESESGNPGGQLVEGRDGVLYGASASGGAVGNSGTVYKLNKDGSGYQILHTFIGPGGDAVIPGAGLLEGSDGMLYGTTSMGGSNFWPGYGAIFTLNKNGGGYRVLYSFAYDQDGRSPAVPLCEGSDGALYGTTPNGGTNDLGTVFRVGKSGGDFRLLYCFRRTDSDGSVPRSGLVRGNNGALYGTTSLGGVSGLGTFFAINEDGGGYACLRSFVGVTGGDATHPRQELLEGRDGRLYGASYDGGLTNQGAIFTVNKDGTGYTILRHFAGFTVRDGHYANGGLIEGSNGTLYGTTYSGGKDENGGGTVYSLQTDGGGYRILHSFTNNGLDGVHPTCGLLAAGDGQLYGTTSGGGGGGTLFRWHPDAGDYAVLHAFTDSKVEGANPKASLVEGTDGALYGTTYSGGTNGSNSGSTIFKVNKDGSDFTVLHHLSANDGEGNRPLAPLLEASDGSLYGTTSWGNGLGYAGSVFRVNKDGTGFQILHLFATSTGDGLEPTSALVEGRDGALYGTTADGGGYGSGTFFRMNKDGTGYEILYNFGEVLSDGAEPQGLIRASDGAFYITCHGGGEMNYGALVQLLPPQTPDMLAPDLQDGFVHFTVTGATGCKYQILRSSDLVGWTVAGAFTMPASGVYAFSDVVASSEERAFYRVAWAP